MKQTSTKYDPASEISFKFPLCIEQGMTFCNDKEIYERIDTEFISRNLRTKFLKIIQFPSETSNLLKFGCRCCCSELTFEQKGDQLVAIFVNNNHVHKKNFFDKKLNKLYLRPEDFVFPKSFEINHRFDSRKELQELLEIEASSRRLPPNLYNFKSSRNSLILTCKICDSTLKLKGMSRGLRVTQIGNSHSHTTENLEAYTQRIRRISDRLIASKKDKKAKKQNSPDDRVKQQLSLDGQSSHDNSKGVTPSFEELASKILRAECQKTGLVSQEDCNIKVEENTRLMSDEYNEINLRELVKKWRAFNKEEGQLNPGELSLTQCPEFLMIITPSMKENYLHYSDILAFCCIPTTVRVKRASYEVGAFAVQDNTGCALLVGIALFKSLNCQSIQKCIGEYFSLLQKKPTTMITCNDGCLNEAMLDLQKSGVFEGSHLYDTGDILRKFIVEFENLSKEDHLRSSALLREAISTRNPKILEDRLKSLKSIPVARSLIWKLLEHRNKIFFCDLPNGFCGYQRNTCTELCNFLTSKFDRQEVRIQAFLAQLAEIDKHSLENPLESGKPLSCFEMELSNPRLKEVRTQYSKEAVSLLVENYIAAIMHFRTIVKVVEQMTTVVVVEDRLSLEKYVVTDWHCQCKEMEKTGIGCPHLIAAVVSCEILSYTTMLSNRWKISNKPIKELTVIV